MTNKKKKQPPRRQAPKRKPIPAKNYNIDRSNKDEDGFILLSKWQGRFGNRMHQYAYGATYANKFGIDFVLPSDWEGTKLFNGVHSVAEDDELRLHINQTDKQFDNDVYRRKAIKDYSKRINKDVEYINPHDSTESYCGKKTVWFTDIACYQEEIFKEMSLKYLRKIFEFKDEIKNLDIYKKLEDRQGKYNIAHLRRDDISNPSYDNNRGYSVISKNSYEKAFKKFGVDPKKVEWTTDDWTGNWGVGKPSDKPWHTRRGGWTYPVGSEFLPEIGFEWLPDFLRLYFARSVFRANSSFSFWACLLGKQKKTFSPVLTERNIYSGKIGSGIEIDVDFVEGNDPHWLCLEKDHCGKILIPE